MKYFKKVIIKSNVSFFIATLFLCVWTVSVKGQTSIQKGKAQLIEFTNATPNFIVPEGKTWVVYSIFSDYASFITNATDGNNYNEIKIFIKNINGVEKTNSVKNLYGTQVYRSSNTSTAFPYPIIFPEKTSLSFIIMQGELEKIKEYSGKAYISFVEVEN